MHTPLDEWSARSRDFYLTTHNTLNRQIPMPHAGFEAAIPASERPQTHALDRDRQDLLPERTKGTKISDTLAINTYIGNRSKLYLS
jgi:hypothetical protein